MKFINYLGGITGIGIFPLISLCIFFLFFTVLLMYTLRADKEHIKQLGELPLQ